MAMRDLAMNLEDQMLVLLELGCRGEDILSHGAWETPVKRLAMKEYVVKIGNGYRITDKGRAFFAKSEGVDVAEVEALAPVLPDWIVTPLDQDGQQGLVVLRKNDLTVSGYEAMCPSFRPIVQGYLNDVDTMLVRGDCTMFLQAMLDAAWARGLRPSNGE